MTTCEPVVPMIDASAHGFNLDMSWTDVQKMPKVGDDIPPRSIGVIFYTVHDQGFPNKPVFNLHGFAFLSEHPDDDAAGSGDAMDVDNEPASSSSSRKRVARDDDDGDDDEDARRRGSPVVKQEGSRKKVRA